MNVDDIVLPTDLSAVTRTNGLRRLQDSVQQLHGCLAAHVATIPLTDQRDGKILWQGAVEVFDLQGHPNAERCYAWASRVDDGWEYHITVLRLELVDSPRSAVRAALSGDGSVKTKLVRTATMHSWEPSRVG
jgi:hypothetical protein